MLSRLYANPNTLIKAHNPHSKELDPSIDRFLVNASSEMRKLILDHARERNLKHCAGVSRYYELVLGEVEDVYAKTLLMSLHYTKLDWGNFDRPTSS